MSKLEEHLSNELFTRFGQYSIRRNYAPDWLRETGHRLQLDFYIDELKIAAEVQGDQHYKFTPHFHGDLAGFEALQQRDRDKAFLCKKHGVELHEIFTYTDADLFVQEIQNRQDPQARFVIIETEAEIERKYGVDIRISHKVRKARRAILRHAQDNLIIATIAEIMNICEECSLNCYVPEIVEYYKAHHEIIDLSRRIYTCPHCTGKDSLRKFSEKSLQEHILAKHSV